jgi:hypothetical protein
MLLEKPTVADFCAVKAVQFKRKGYGPEVVAAETGIWRGAIWCQSSKLSKLVRARKRLAPVASKPYSV